MQVQSQTSTPPTSLEQGPDRLSAHRPDPEQSASDTPAAAARLEAIGARHGFALTATRAMAQAISNGGGGMAQFDHPDLGGSGQWMLGGMVMIGDMFNRALASRVGALGNDLAAWQAEQARDIAPPNHADSDVGSSHWWPAELQHPNSSGAQNNVRYAYFANDRRLAIERAGIVELYDTGEHRIGGVSQQQRTDQVGGLCFSSQLGDVDLGSLRRLDQGTAVSAQSAPGNAAEPTQPPPTADSREALDLLSKLADLHARGVLSDDEFTTKKSDLLRRI